MILVTPRAYHAARVATRARYAGYSALLIFIFYYYAAADILHMPRFRYELRQIDICYYAIRATPCR